MYNKVIMIGNLTRDIELKYLPSGSAIANGAIATSHKYKMQSGEQKEEVCFIDFSVFGKQGEVLNQYVYKGSKVMLEGRLMFEQWSDNQSGAKRSKHTLRVENFKFLDSKSDSSNQGQGNNYNAPSSQPAYNNQSQQHNQQPAYNTSAQQQPQYNQQRNQPQQHQYRNSNDLAPEPSRNVPTIDIVTDEIPF